MGLYFYIFCWGVIYTYSKLPFPMSPTSAVAFFDPRNRVDRTVSLAVFGWPHFSGAPEQRIEEKHHKMTLVTLVLLCESLEVDGVIYQDWSKYIKNLSSQFKTTSPTSPRNNDLASEISSSPYKGNWGLQRVQQQVPYFSSFCMGSYGWKNWF